MANSETAPAVGVPNVVGFGVSHRGGYTVDMMAPCYVSPNLGEAGTWNVIHDTVRSAHVSTIHEAWRLCRVWCDEVGGELSEAWHPWGTDGVRWAIVGAKAPTGAPTAC